MLKSTRIPYLLMLGFYLIGRQLAAQNSIVGDGFGGRLWYQPCNFTVGSYSAYTVCGPKKELFGWGSNNINQISADSIFYYRYPKKIPKMDSVYYYSCGYAMGCIRNDLSGWVWGSVSKDKPTRVISNAKFVEAGTNIVSFVKTDGTVWSVGNNYTGSFGNDSLDNINTLKPHKMLVANAVRIANSLYTNAVLLADGRVVCAGMNTVGGLGNNAPFNTRALRPVLTNLKHIVDIKATAQNTIALDRYGSVWTWGANQGGIGNVIDITNPGSIRSPVKVTSLKNIVAISACNDGDVILALDSSGSCYAWGQFSGFWSDTPVLVSEDVIDILAGETFIYIIKRNGKIFGRGSGNIWLKDSALTYTDFTLVETQKRGLCWADFTSKVKLIEKHYSICRGDSILLGLRYYHSDTMFSDTFNNGKINNDSIITSKLSLRSPSYTTQNYSFCRGDSVRVGNNIYHESGIYRDVITNAAGCDSVIETSVTVHNSSHSNTNISLCRGDTFRTGGQLYTSTDIIRDTFQNYQGCDSLVNINLTFHENPISDFGFPDSLFVDSIFRFQNLSQAADVFRWNFTEGPIVSSSEPNPFYRPQKHGPLNVTLHASHSVSGCSDSIQKTLNVYFKLFDVFTPNAFRPNGDGLNDVFTPVFQHYDHAVLKIFNIWGECLLHSNPGQAFWDGTYDSQPVEQGVYFWHLTVQSLSGEVLTFRGTVTLLR